MCLIDQYQNRLWWNPISVQSANTNNSKRKLKLIVILVNLNKQFARKKRNNCGKRY